MLESATIKRPFFKAFSAKNKNNARNSKFRALLLFHGSIIIKRLEFYNLKLSLITFTVLWLNKKITFSKFFCFLSVFFKLCIAGLLLRPLISININFKNFDFHFWLQNKLRFDHQMSLKAPLFFPPNIWNFGFDSPRMDALNNKFKAQ